MSMILNASISGEGPPLVLLHGLFGAARNLGALARALNATHRVIAMDLRNHGESPRGLPMDFPTMAADVAQTLDALGLARADVAGHSLGGKTAMALALTRPDMVARLAVLDIAPIPYNHDYDDYVAALRSIPLHPGLTRGAADQALAATIKAAPMRAFLLNNLFLGEMPGWRVGLAEIAAAMPDLLDWQYRLFLLAFAGLLASAAVLFSGALSFIRIIGLARLGEAANLSHRNLVWPYFEHAFLASPFFGWGVGAGKVVIPYNATLATLLGTNAAHDEYLRIGTEGGAFGLILLILLLGLWGYRGSAHLPVAQRLFMRLIFIGFAIQSATDNTLIATTSSVLFLWCSGIFASSEKPPKAAA